MATVAARLLVWGSRLKLRIQYELVNPKPLTMDNGMHLGAAEAMYPSCRLQGLQFSQLRSPSSRQGTGCEFRA